MLAAGSLVHGVTLTAQTLSSVTLEFAHASATGSKMWTELAKVTWADSDSPVTQHWKFKEPVRAGALRISAGTASSPAFHEVQVWSKVSEPWNILSDGFTTMAWCGFNYTNRRRPRSFSRQGPEIRAD